MKKDVVAANSITTRSCLVHLFPSFDWLVLVFFISSDHTSCYNCMIVGIIAHQHVHLLVYLKPMHPFTRSIDCFILAQFRQKLSSQSLFQFTRLGQPSPYYPAQILLPQWNEVIAYPFPRPWLHLIAALGLLLFIYAQPIIMKSLLLSPSFPASQLCINIPSPPNDVQHTANIITTLVNSTDHLSRFLSYLSILLVAASWKGDQDQGASVVRGMGQFSCHYLNYQRSPSQRGK